MSIEREDHDQRLKVLLKEFFPQFFQCFFPPWAGRFDFSEIVWLDKEFFLSPPSGVKRHLDLVARLRLRAEAPPPWPGCEGLLVLVHIEVESGDSVQTLRPRMFEYYVQLRRESQLPVLPISLYLRVGMEGVGWDRYEERFWDHTLLHFEYAYVGLPALAAEEYAAGENLLGAALSSLMRVPAERRAELQLQALKRIAVSSENDYRRYLLAECLETYSKADDEVRHMKALLDSEPFQEVRSHMGILGLLREEVKLEGKLEGNLEGRREILLALLEAKFGCLSAEVVQRVNELDGDALRKLSLELLKAQSLQELHLQD